MMSEDIRTACLDLRSRLSSLRDLDLDIASDPIANLKSALTPAAIAPFSRDLGTNLRPYAVEVHKELRLLQMDVARWSAARQPETKRSRLCEIQQRGERLSNYLDALLQADRATENPA